MRMPIIVVAAAALAACSSVGRTPLRGGMTEAAVVQAWGPPSARHALPAGTRLEYATGPAGLQTWMVDLDPAGRAVLWRPVLSYTHLQRVQGQLAGQTQDELLATLGRPGHQRADRLGGEVWSWYHESPFCLWFQVSIDVGGRVKDAAFAPDPRCDEQDR